MVMLKYLTRILAPREGYPIQLYPTAEFATEFSPTVSKAENDSTGKPLSHLFLSPLCSQTLPSGLTLVSNLSSHLCPLNTPNSKTMSSFLLPGHLQLSPWPWMPLPSSFTPGVLGATWNASLPRQLTSSQEQPLPGGPHGSLSRPFLSARHTQLCGWPLGSIWFLN